MVISVINGRSIKNDSVQAILTNQLRTGKALASATVMTSNQVQEDARVEAPSLRSFGTVSVKQEAVFWRWHIGSSRQFLVKMARDDLALA